MIYITRVKRLVSLHRHLMTEDHFETKWIQNVNSRGELIGIGYLIQQHAHHSKAHRKTDNPSGMARRILQYAKKGKREEIR